MSEGTLFYSEGLDEAQCRAVLDALPGLSYALVQDENSIAFVSWPHSAGAASGQAFGEQLEARWRFFENAWEIVLATEQQNFAPPSIPGTWQISAAAVDDRHDIYLWGNHWQSLAGGAETDLDGWVQAEVDAHLQYPVDGGAAKPLVVATARTYRQNGIPVLTRLLDVRAEKQ